MTRARRAVVAAAVGVAVLAAAACGRKPDGREPPPSTIVVKEETIVVRTGKIGLRNDTRDGTYVLVDVENRSAEPRLIAVDGVLLHADGRELGALHADELYVPAGEKRAFALVHGQPVAEARSARVRIAGAPVATRPPDLEIVTPNVRADGGRLVAAPLVRNPTTQPALVTVITAFYDDQGRILARPFNVLPLAPGETRATSFHGPEGAATAQVYLGQIAF